MLRKLKDEPDLRLQSLFACRQAAAKRYVRKKKWARIFSRPGRVRATVIGFWRFSNPGEWPQAGEQRRAFGKIFSQFSRRSQVRS
jgi:hypothetical protein